MSHPMEPYLDARRAERDRLWARRDQMEARLNLLTLDKFTFAQFADLQLVADRGAPGRCAYDLTQAIDRLEKFLGPEKKPAKKPRRRSR